MDLLSTFSRYAKKKSFRSIPYLKRMGVVKAVLTEKSKINANSCHHLTLEHVCETLVPIICSHLKKVHRQMLK